MSISRYTFNKMKKVILIILVLCFVGVVLFLISKIQEEQKDAEQAKSELEVIPQIELYNLDNGIVKLNDICTDKTIIAYFSTTCDICHVEAKEFNRLKNDFDDSTVIFIANNTNEEIREFISTNGLIDNKFIFLYDKDYTFITNYDIPTTPFTLLYIGGELYKTYKGAVRIEQIIRDKNDKES